LDAGVGSAAGQGAKAATEADRTSTPEPWATIAGTNGTMVLVTPTTFTRISFPVADLALEQAAMRPDTRIGHHQIHPPARSRNAPAIRFISRCPSRRGEVVDGRAPPAQILCQAGKDSRVAPKSQRDVAARADVASPSP